MVIERLRPAPFHAEDSWHDATSPASQAFLDALGVAVYTTDAHGVITSFNEAAAELWGRRPEIGKDMWCGSWKIYRPDGSLLPHDECPMGVTLREDRAVRGEEAIAERPDGTRVWFAPFPTPLHDDSGALIGAVNVLVDITDAKRAEAAGAYLSAVVESSDDAIVSKDLDSIITSWNQGAERIFGYSAEEAVGRSIRLIIPPDRMSEEDDVISRVRRGERIDHFETVRRRKDGSEIAISLTVSPVKDGRGRIIGASKIARDITPRKQAEQALRESQQRLTLELAASERLQVASSQLIGEENPDALYEGILDAAVAIMHADFASLQQLHPERGDFPGELLLLGHRGFTAEAAEFWKWVRPSSESTCGVALRTGRRCIVSDVDTCAFMAGTDDLQSYQQTGIRAVQTTPLLSRSGKLLGMISTHWRAPHEPSPSELRLLDVLARQAADLIERSQAQQELAEALAIKDEFIGLVSHELRTPVTTIVGNASILARRDNTLDDETRRAAIDDVRKEADRLNGIIENLLTLARLDRGGIESEPVVLPRVVETAVREARARSGRTIDLQVDGDDGAIVAGDEALLGHVISNYLSNAEKYSPAGSPIDVTIEREDEKVLVRVLDRGIGIEEAEAERLFDSFYRSSNVGKVGGIGIGLSVCRRLINAIDGECWAAPREGGGSEFGFSLPLYDD